MLDSCDSYIITLNRPITYNGVQVFRVWGDANTIDVSGIKFVMVGSDENDDDGHHLLIAVDNIMFALKQVDHPTDSDVLICDGTQEPIFGSIYGKMLYKMAS